MPDHLSRLNENLEKYKNDISAEEELVRTILNQIEEAVIITDQDHMVVSVNPSAEKLFNQNQRNSLERDSCSRIITIIRPS
jgi:nitrogen fixation/metabolism regulation signal transduction histidine kinase